MASEIHGRDVLGYIDIGSSTFTALLRELEVALEVQGDVQQAVNKSASAAAGADYGTGYRHTFRVSGHIPSTALDTALDQIDDDIRSQTKTPVRMVKPNPYHTYEGNVVWSQESQIAPAGDFVTVNCQGQFDGLPSKSTT